MDHPQRSTDAFASKLDQLTSQNDQRTSVFDLQIKDMHDGTLSLSGRLLEESQLDSLSDHFPGLKLDTASIRILAASWARAIPG
ncbi:MAG TPA: hypothetical protein VI524_00320 [Anaerolineales bacterium]|nr:hypothetical protein [Anaerolineales bacterium]